VLTRTRRTVLVASAVAAIVTAANASDGAYFSQSWGWVALAFLVPTTLVLILHSASRPGKLRVAFAALMGAFALWIALSTIWSISMPASVREIERMLVYVAMALAVAIVLRRGDGVAVFTGALAGGVAVASYALATRLFPDVFGFTDDPLHSRYRLAEPLGYWNSLGLLAAIGLILASGSVAHARSKGAVLAAASVLPLLSATLYFTFSRGSWVALAFGVVGTVVLDPRRLRFAWSLAVVAPASIACVVVASRQDALTTEDSTAAAATHDGHRFAWMLAGLVLCSAGLGWIAYRIANRVPFARHVRRVASVALVAGVVAIAVVAVASAGGPAGAVESLRDRFEAPPTGGRDLNDRLFSASGTGRADLIEVAWEVGSEHVIDGTGAGTFEYAWYERRPNLEVVRDAHSLYAEVFAELGIVGVGLLVAMLLVPLVASVRARRSRYTAPATGAYLAWLAAAGLDWHWEMVGVTLVAVLAGCVGLVASERGSAMRMGSRSRGALIGLAVTLSIFAVWSLVGNQALFAAREAAARKDWRDAHDDARRARALLLWSAEPDLVLGDAAAGLGDREGALRAFRDAVATDPRNWVAWLRLAQVARGAERAAAYDRVRELNPLEEGLPGE
jgi:O-antigen ligase